MEQYEFSGIDDNATKMLIILTFVCIFYGLVENCEDIGGTAESLLLTYKKLFCYHVIISDNMGNSFWSSTYRLHKKIYSYIKEKIKYKIFQKTFEKSKVFFVPFFKSCHDSCSRSLYRF